MKGLALLLLLTLALPAGATGRRARGYLCEKKDASGKVSILQEANSRKICKKAGGRWVHSSTAGTAADVTPGSASTETATLTATDTGQNPTAAAQPATASTSTSTSTGKAASSAP
jgi:hypothetical protein